MKVVAITQRVVTVPEYGERRDCLDQAWPRFLAECGLTPIVLPNVLAVALQLCAAADLGGVVFTGGNDLAQCGGDAPERDAVEFALLDWAQKRGLPVLGVCRGMQVIQRHFGIALHRVDGNVARRQVIRVEGKPREVNSFHHYAALESRPPLRIWATAEDGAVVKAIRHSTEPIMGIMWHPERCSPFSPADVALFREVFAVQ
ncbi:MAG: gamma-glutamyl-gamma-aminobutyrate hydrolase family protein [Terriglobales bacterium]